MKIFVFQLGLDPRATTIANLFMDATCVGEKIINNEYCFILKIETGAAICEAQVVQTMRSSTIQYGLFDSIQILKAA